MKHTISWSPLVCGDNGESGPIYLLDWAIIFINDLHSMDRSGGNSLQALIGRSEISVFGHLIENGNGEETLVQTGYILDFKMLIGIGMVIFLVGLIILFKKKKA